METTMTSDLIAAFNEFFELIHADNDALRMQVYQLRYQVYVLETGFESEADCLSGFDESGQLIHWEMDEYDSRSDHYLLRHRRTGVYAATARLVLPDWNHDQADYPIEQHCPLTERITSPSLRTHLGEISRFAVSKTFKKRIGESGTLAGVASNVDIYFEEDERRILPHISLGLFAAVMRMMHSHGITHFYAVMEPALLRLLGRFGVVFNRIGPEVEYHGLRVPCLGSVDEALPSIKIVAPAVWDLITNRGELVRKVA
jgi:N-acyl amino acid synthase of PEP-CTERM/exosortase system